MQHVPYVDDPLDLKGILRPFLEWDLTSWNGLPRVLVKTFSAVLGRPEKVEDARLGWYPAQRFSYPVSMPGGGLDVYVREHEVVLIEMRIPPPLSAMDALGSPSAVKPHEILLEGAYVHEYLFCEKGLVFSVAEPFEEGLPLHIVRCRGIRRIDSPDQFGPEFYQSFEDRIVW